MEHCSHEILELLRSDPKSIEKDYSYLYGQWDMGLGFSLPRPRPIFNLTPEDLTIAVMNKVGVALPTVGAVMDNDGIVHEIIGNNTKCHLMWAYFITLGSAVMPGYIGWGALRTVDINCMVCLAEE